MGIEGEEQDETAGNGNESFEGVAGVTRLHGLYEKYRNKEALKREAVVTQAKRRRELWKDK